MPGGAIKGGAVGRCYCEANIIPRTSKGIAKNSTSESPSFQGSY